MRIISKDCIKIDVLNCTKPKIRPTTDFAKESLFNVLQNHYKLDGSDSARFVLREFFTSNM